MAKFYKIVVVGLFTMTTGIFISRRSICFDPFLLIVGLAALICVFSLLSVNRDIKDGTGRKISILGADPLLAVFLYVINLFGSSVRSDLGDLPFVSVMVYLSFCKMMSWDEAEQKATPYNLNENHILAVKIFRGFAVISLVYSIWALALQPFEI